MASVPTSTAVDARPTVAAQGGVLEGMDPTHYDSKQPIVLFIIQVGSPKHAEVLGTGDTIACFAVQA